MELNKKDRKIIIINIYPVIFNVSVSLILGIIVILIFPVITNKYIRFETESLLLIQVTLTIILLTLSVVYFLSKTRKQRVDLKNGNGISKRERLINKKCSPKRTYIYYLPENVKNDNIYELTFESTVLKVNDIVFNQLETGKEFELNYSPISDIFLSISDNDKKYYC